MHECFRSNFEDDIEILWVCKEEQGILYLFVHEEIKPDTIIGIGVKFCPFCGYQPERSKREDLEEIKCKECEKTQDDILRSVCCDNCLYKYLDFSKMRCSEHCGNTVRDK